MLKVPQKTSRCRVHPDLLSHRGRRFEDAATADDGLSRKHGEATVLACRLPAEVRIRCDGRLDFVEAGMLIGHLRPPDVADWKGVEPVI